MQKAIFYTVWIILLTVIQTTLIPYIKIAGIIPDLFILFTIGVALLFSTPDAGMAGFVLGFILDLYGGKSIGINALIYMYAGILCGVSFRSFLKKRIELIILTSFCVTVLCSFSYYALSSLIWGEGYFSYALLHIILPNGVYNAVLSIPVILLIRRTGRSLLK